MRITNVFDATFYNKLCNACKVLNPKLKWKVEFDDWVFIKIRFAYSLPRLRKISKKQDRAIYPKQKGALKYVGQYGGQNA